MAKGGWFDLSRVRNVGLLLACLCAGISTPARAADALERELLHQDAVFVLEVQQPLEWARHPLLKRVWSALSQTQQLQAALETPEFQRAEAARDYLQTATGQNWDEALSQLTAGGVWIAVTPKPNERATLIIRAAGPEMWTRLESAVLKTLENQGQQPPPSQTYHGIKAYRVEKSFVAFVGNRLVAASQEADLTRIIDQLLKHSEAAATPPASASSQPSLTLHVDLKTVRQIPGLQKTLNRPANDAGQVAILGGWLDVLATADRLSANLSWPENSTEIELNLTARNVEATALLAGFFARSPSHALSPMLEPPGTIYSASWFRDYAAIWNQRADLLTESALGKIEKGDNDVKQQFSVFGVSFTASELFKQLGTEFRVVLARADHSEYRVKQENKLPQAAVCISLRDEQAFLEQAEPLSRAIGLIAAFGEAKMLTKTTQHAQAKLRGLWFRDDEKAAGQGNRLRFNFNPTWTVAREHFILGSTRDIVAKVIDELDRQTAASTKTLETPLGSPRVTDRQLLSFNQFGEALSDFREAILQGSALDRGLSLPEAVTELDLAQDAINALGKLTTQAAFTQDGFEYQIKLQSEVRGQGSEVRK